jgi:LPS sulfotransferase NodH
MRPRLRYLICTTPRCGSWLLAETLLATGVAGRPEEYLRPDWFLRYRARGSVTYEHRLNWWPEARDWFGSVGGTGDPSTAQVDQVRRFDHVLRDEASAEELRAFLDAVLDAGTTDNGVFGAKVHWGQLSHALAVLRPRGARGPADPPVTATDARLLAHWLPGVRFVHLRRRDGVRRAISHYRAMSSGVWFRAGGSQPPAPATVLDRTALETIDSLRRVSAQGDAQWRRLFQHAGIRPLELLYEEVSLDPVGATAKVVAYLGLPRPAPATLPQPRLKRQADEWTDAAVHAYLTWKRANRPIRSKEYGNPYGLVRQ